MPASGDLCFSSLCSIKYDSDKKEDEEKLWGWAILSEDRAISYEQVQF